MKLVFASSALPNLIRSAGSRAFNYLKGNYILSLTLYEIGNALWRETTLLKRTSISEALSLPKSINNICKIMNTINPHNNLLVLKLAHELRITYYDSSYIIVSYELNAGLVTDDENLERKYC